jgi:UDP:flavonoid glycosyltransferase YjiC (YdhE family)
MLVDALADLPVTVLVATAGRVCYESAAQNVRVADFLPGDAAVARSNLVVCNGGSPATQQALTAGVPVLAFPSNLDQFLNMHGIVQARAGISVRPSAARPDAVRRVAEVMLRDLDYTRSAQELAQLLRQYDAAVRFRTFLDEVL